MKTVKQGITIAADALLPLEMVYAYEPIPPEAPSAAGDVETEVGGASEGVAPMSPNGGVAGDSDGDMEYSADGCAVHMRAF